MVEASVSLSCEAKKSREPSVFLACVTSLLEAYGAKRESIADCEVFNNGMTTYLVGAAVAEENVVNEF